MLHGGTSLRDEMLRVEARSSTPLQNCCLGRRHRLQYIGSPLCLPAPLTLGVAAPTRVENRVRPRAGPDRNFPAIVKGAGKSTVHRTPAESICSRRCLLYPRWFLFLFCSFRFDVLFFCVVTWASAASRLKLADEHSWRVQGECLSPLPPPEHLRVM